MRAFLKNYSQSPRKVRIVANYIKGKSVSDALLKLALLNKRASDPIAKLLKSAVANAEQTATSKADLVVKDIRVDKGIVFKRMMPRARGSAARINKRTSRVLIVLGEQSKTKNVKSKVKNDK